MFVSVRAWVCGDDHKLSTSALGSWYSFDLEIHTYHWMQTSKMQIVAS